MKKLSIIFAFCFLLTGSIYAQKPSPKIVSGYTNLDKDCKAIRGGEGQDDASDCKGLGGYRIYFSPSAAMQSIFAETLDKETSIPLANVGLDFDQKKRNVEWRMANGKPFAVILRVDKYADPDDEHPYIGKKIGEQLIVRGLKGFEDINTDIDVKTPNANAKARDVADTAYLKIINKSSV